MTGSWVGEIDRADRVLAGDDPFDESGMDPDTHTHQQREDAEERAGAR